MNEFPERLRKLRESRRPVQSMTVTELRDALLGHKLPMDTWRAIGAALSRLEPEN